MKKTMVSLLILLLLVGLCACASEPAAPAEPTAQVQADPALVEFCTGSFFTPQDECSLADILEFYPGGSCNVPEYTWAITGNVLNITVSLPNNVHEVYGFTINTEEGILQALFNEHVFYYKG